MELPIEFEVLPLYAQVVIQEPGTADLPDWVTGDDAVVSTARAVYVATRPDSDGLVTVKVVEGSSPASDGRLVYSGELRTDGAVIEVGSPLAGDSVRVPINASSIRLEVFVMPSENPSSVTFRIGAA